MRPTATTPTSDGIFVDRSTVERLGSVETILAHFDAAGFTFAERLGQRIYARSKTRIKACPTVVLVAMLWSMSRIRSFRELLATGENECRALVDLMVAAAPRARSVSVSRARR